MIYFKYTHFNIYSHLNLLLTSKVTLLFLLTFVLESDLTYFFFMSDIFPVSWLFFYFRISDIFIQIVRGSSSFKFFLHSLTIHYKSYFRNCLCVLTPFYRGKKIKTIYSHPSFFFFLLNMFFSQIIIRLRSFEMEF